MLIGLLACLGASLLLGTLFVPIKRCPPTDGFATQLFMCLGAYLTSFLVYFYMELPGLYGLPMIGGALWATTNCFAVFIMSHMGMAMFMLFASSISCLTGWATSRFGLFGVPASFPMSALLNYAGIIMLILGSSIYSFIKINVFKATKTVNTHVNVLPMNKLSETRGRLSEDNSKHEDVEMKSSIFKVVAWVGTILVGLSLGVMTTPITLLMTRRDIYPVASSVESPLVFHFSFFTGVIITSAIAFVLYSIVRKGKPQIPAGIVLPSMLSGGFFSIAISFFIIANEKLSPTISYPICMMAPGLVTSAWSVLFFKEITGLRNLLLLGAAYLFTLSGVLVITLSRVFKV